jgi:hypothetical protein
MERRTHRRLTTEELAGRRRPDLWEPGVPSPSYSTGFTYDPEPPLAAPRRGAEAAARGDANPFFGPEERERLSALWTELQGAFVDDPRAALARADELVARVMQRLAEVFSDERAHLDAQLAHARELSTEDQRLTLQRYRLFFTRLLSL